MKCLTTALVAFFLLGIPSAFADDVTKNAKIEELMKLTNAAQLMNQMFDQMRSMQMAELNKMTVPAGARRPMQETQEKVLALLQDTLSWEKMKPMLAKVYADTFTEEELDGILNFYKSPAGQAMLQKMPMLMQRSIALGQQMVENVTPQIQKIVQDALKESGQRNNDPNTSAPAQPPKGRLQ